MPHWSMMILSYGTFAALAILCGLALPIDFASPEGMALAAGLFMAGRRDGRSGTAADTADRTAGDIPGLGWIADVDHCITGLGPQFRDHFGSDAYGKSCCLEHALHRDDVEEATLQWRRVWKTGGEFQGAYRFRGADQEYRWFLSTARALRNQEGQVTGWCGSLADIHLLKSVDSVNPAAIQSLHSLLDSIPAMISVARGNGLQEYNNKASVDFHRKSYDQLTGTQALDSIHPDDRGDFMVARAHCLEQAVPLDYRMRVRRGDGVYRWVQLRSQPVFDESGSLVRWYGITLDIDDQIHLEEGFRHAQEQLARASHLTTLAELSASIAHEVKQPLAAVVSNSDACLAWLSADPPNLLRARGAAERIVRDSMAASDVVARIRALFARTDPTRTATDLREVVEEVRHIMTKQASSEGVKIETAFDPQPLNVLADRVQIQQVLVNLIRNGLDAMKSNATERKSLSISVKRLGETVLVEVCDTGAGIEDPSRIFEPFFTTKKDGMGMGLAICRSIVEEHEGAIWAAPGTPHGTIVAIRLPVLTLPSDSSSTLGSAI